MNRSRLHLLAEIFVQLPLQILRLLRWFHPRSVAHDHYLTPLVERVPLFLIPMKVRLPCHQPDGVSKFRVASAYWFFPY
jgi:hypothetical protein